MLQALYALEFWKCAGIGLSSPEHNKKEKDFWWSEFLERRAKAMGVPVGHKKFSRSSPKFDSRMKEQKKIQEMLRLNMEIERLDPFQPAFKHKLKHYCGLIGWERTAPINGAYIDEVISIWLLPENRNGRRLLKLSEVLWYMSG